MPLMMMILVPQQEAKCRMTTSSNNVGFSFQCSVSNVFGPVVFIRHDLEYVQFYNNHSVAVCVCVCVCVSLTRHHPMSLHYRALGLEHATCPPFQSCVHLAAPVPFVVGAFGFVVAVDGVAVRAHFVVACAMPPR
jgi:hypothetical protein